MDPFDKLRTGFVTLSAQRIFPNADANAANLQAAPALLRYCHVRTIRLWAAKKHKGILCALFYRRCWHRF